MKTRCSGVITGDPTSNTIPLHIADMFSFSTFTSHWLEKHAKILSLPKNVEQRVYCMAIKGFPKVSRFQTEVRLEMMGLDAQLRCLWKAEMYSYAINYEKLS